MKHIIRHERHGGMSTGQWLSAALLCLAAGCATAPKPNNDYVFFPAPPDEPRIQYLTSFSSEDDLGGHSKVSEFVLGRDRIFNPIWKPYGITTTDGTIYICDADPANVVIVDLRKQRIRYLKPQGQAAMQLPINIAVDTNGVRYVTDTGRNQVVIYNVDGSYVGAMGKTGEMRPCGIAIAGDRLYVTDLSNHCVRVYGKANRELLFTVPRKVDEKSQLYSPTNVTIDEHGNIHVTDTGGFCVQVYDAEGNHVRKIGQQGLDPGTFSRPKGIGVDHLGRVYVVDADTAVVQLFDAEGRLLMHFGQPEKSGVAGLYLPAGLAIDYKNVALFQKYVAPGNKIEYLIFVTNQTGTHKVSVYGFLHKE